MARLSTQGKKRLISMPDRVTNTIGGGPGGLGGTVFRPTVINCYAGDMPDAAAWYRPIPPPLM